MGFDYASAAMEIVRLQGQTNEQRIYIDQLEQRLSAAERERDEALSLLAACRDACGEWHETDLSVEAVGNPDVVPLRVKEALHQAIAWGEKLKEALAEFLRNPGGDYTEDIAEEALSTPAPAALSHLRQEIIERCAKVCEDLDMYDEDSPGSSYAAAIRRLAEEQEGQG